MVFRDELQEALFGKSTHQAVETKTRVTCEDPDLDFETPKQRREYYMSGMCRRCQDEVFHGES